MAGYLDILDNEVSPESPLTASVLLRLRNNPLLMGQCDPTAPSPNLAPRVETFFGSTVDESHQWVVPDGVNRILIEASGGGGGGSGTADPGTDGGASSVTTSFGTLAASGGAGGRVGTYTMDGVTTYEHHPGSLGGGGGRNGGDHGEAGQPGHRQMGVHVVTPGETVSLVAGRKGTGGSGAGTGGDGASGWVRIFY